MGTDTGMDGIDRSRGSRLGNGWTEDGMDKGLTFSATTYAVLTAGLWEQEIKSCV